MTLRVDTSALDKLVADLGQIPATVLPEARKVVARGANNIKKDARKRWRGHPHARMLPYAVSYDVKQRATSVEAEIGPDKDKPQGALGNLFEYGSLNNAPIPALAPALQAEEPGFVKYLEELAVKALEDL